MLALLFSSNVLQFFQFVSIHFDRSWPFNLILNDKKPYPHKNIFLLAAQRGLCLFNQCSWVFVVLFLVVYQDFTLFFRQIWRALSLYSQHKWPCLEFNPPEMDTKLISPSGRLWNKNFAVLFALQIWYTGKNTYILLLLCHFPKALITKILFLRLMD